MSKSRNKKWYDQFDDGGTTKRKNDKFSQRRNKRKEKIKSKEIDIKDDENDLDLKV